MAKKTTITTAERTDTVIRAIKLIREGHSLLSAMGCRLMFDSYNDDGPYVVPKAVDFPDSSGPENTDAAEFLGKCPKIITVDGIYNDGSRGVDKVPRWWNSISKKISTFLNQ